MKSISSAGATLAALAAMNLLNYVDRYVVTALLPNIAADLNLSDGAGGMLGAAFMVVYFMASPVFGLMGDRGRRPLWLAIGVAIWSVSTAAAGLARSLVGLFVSRAAVGVGEAAYGTIAPSLLADHFGANHRGRVMAAFSAAMPIGGALGYLLGGVLGSQIGWRHAFFWVGLPGLALAGCALLLPDPPRGQHDAVAAPAATGLGAIYRGLGRNRRFVWTVAGYTAYTFALGGLAFWMPTYMMRVQHQPQARGMLLFGGITVITGLVGTLLGGALGDRLREKSVAGYAWLNTGSMVAAAIASAAMLTAPTFPLFVAALAIAQMCAFLSVGPVNVILVEAVPAAHRATAMAACIFCIHLFGDAISPALIGTLSDQVGLAAAMRLVPAVFLVAAGLWGLSLRPRHRRLHEGSARL